MNPIGSGPADSGNPAPAPGYYPTRKEWDTIGGYYPRYQGDVAGGAESAANTQAPAGLWPYPSTQDPLFGAHPAFFDAVDRYLGLFSPQGGVNLEGPNPSVGALYSLTSPLPFVTRAFNPNRATFKLGPVYIDLLDVNSTLLYSQYHGPDVFPPGKGPGWLPYESLDFRVVVPLAENLFLAASGDVYWLPRNGQVGFFFGDGFNPNLGLNLFAAYEKEIHGWWLTLTDHLGVEDQFLNFYTNTGSTAYDQAGRYSFGNPSVANRSYIDPFSSDAFFLVNRADASVIGLLDPNWRLTGDLLRTDSWNFDNFTLGDTHFETTQATIRIDYAGQDWRFAPYADYIVSTWDNFQSVVNQADIGVRGPITEQLRLTARVGYFWTNGLDTNTQGFVYEAGLDHDFGPYTRESLYAGSVVNLTDFGQRQDGRYIRYTLNQVLSRRLNAGLWAQWSDARDIDALDTVNGFSGGVFLNYQIGDFTELIAGAYYEKFDTEVSPDYKHLLYMVSLNHRIRAGLTARLMYQKERYQETGGINNFNENLFELQLTQTF